MPSEDRQDRDIRLIALDVDGTLVDDDKNVPPANLRALHAARERGVEVAIASGRMIPSIELMQERLGIDCTLIAYNGGKVVGRREKGRPVISHSPLDRDVAAGLIDFACSEGHPLNFYHEDRLYCDEAHRDSELTAIYGGRTRSPFEYTDIRKFRGEPPTKIIILAWPGERERLYEKLSGELGDAANVMRTDPEYLEIMAPGVDKGTALPDLARYVGVGVESVLAVGDGDNDLQMILTAGVGVAVANSRPTVLAEAPHRTKRTNNEGAVAEAIERWVLGETPELWG